MAATILFGNEPFTAAGATPDGDNLWVSFAELQAATGWERKPQGMCEGERCVPLPPQLEARFIDADARFNLAAFGRYLDQPIVRDDASATWVFGEAAAARRGALAAPEAPDFSLPDLAGMPHSLRDYRGRKVLLLAWASW